MMHDLTTIQRMNAAMQAAAQQPEKRRYQMEVRVQTGSTYIYLVFPRSPRRVYRQLREVVTLRKHQLLWLTDSITSAVKAGKSHTYHYRGISARVNRRDYKL